MKSRNGEWEEGRICLSDPGLIHLIWLSLVASNPLETFLTLRQAFGRVQWVEMRVVDPDNQRVSCGSRLCQHKPTVTRERACMIGCRLGPTAVKLLPYSELTQFRKP